MKPPSTIDAGRGDYYMCPRAQRHVVVRRGRYGIIMKMHSIKSTMPCLRRSPLESERSCDAGVTMRGQKYTRPYIPAHFSREFRGYGDEDARAEQRPE